MKFKHILAAVVIAAVGVANSYAKTYNLNQPLGYPDFFPIVSDANGINNGAPFGINPDSVAPGSFTDIFNFSLSNQLNVWAEFQAVVAGGFVNPGPVIGPVAMGATSGGLTSYSFNVTGTATTQYGVYTMLLNAAPIPEPEAFAMLLAGLGLVGAIARRRNRAGVALAA